MQSFWSLLKVIEFIGQENLDIFTCAHCFKEFQIQFFKTLAYYMSINISQKYPRFSTNIRPISGLLMIFCRILAYLCHLLSIFANFWSTFYSYLFQFVQLYIAIFNRFCVCDLCPHSVSIFFHFLSIGICNNFSILDHAKLFQDF